ncbi:MAG: O-antigen ligase family protein [Bacteroidetes bacterium]|nr:O-antigen ligase family protein [Bacteroidota bacterium]
MAALFFTPLAVSPFVLDFTLTARFVCLASLLFMSLYFLSRERDVLIFKTDVISLFYLVFVIFTACSILWAHTLSEAIFDSCKLILGFVVFILTRFIFIHHPAFFNSFLKKFPVLLFAIGFIVALLQISHLPDFKKDSMYLVTGMNGHKNLYSSFLFLNLFFLVLGFLKSEKIWKLLSVLCIVLSLVLIVFIRTKAVWIGLSVTVPICGFLFIFQRIKKRGIHFLVPVFLLLVLANLFFLVALPPIIKKGIVSNAEIIKMKPEQRQKSEIDNERLVLWDKTYSVFKKHPVIGVGAGNWQIYFPDETLTGLWRAEDLNYTFQRPHNDLLWILSETGLIGFNLFLLFLFTLLVFIYRAIVFFTDNKAVRTELVLCLAFICGYTVISFFDFPRERVEHITWLNMIFGIALFHIRQTTLLPAFGNLKPRLTFSFAALVLLFVTTVGILRYRGEYYTRKMYDQKRVNNYTGVITNGDKALSFAYTLDPTSLPIKWFTGNARAALADYKNAKLDFHEACGLNPYNRNVLNDLASAYAFIDNVGVAKKLYREAARVSPRFDEPKLNLAAIYIQEHNYKTASECLKDMYHDSERRTQYQQMVNAFLEVK